MPNGEEGDEFATMSCDFLVAFSSSSSSSSALDVVEIQFLAFFCEPSAKVEVVEMTKGVGERFTGK